MRFFAWSAVGAAIFGVVRGMKKGNIQQLIKNFPKNMKATNLQQMTQPLAAGMTQPLAAGMTQPLAAGMTQPLATGMTQPLAAAMTQSLTGKNNNSSTKNATKKQGV